LNRNLKNRMIKLMEEMLFQLENKKNDNNNNNKNKNGTCQENDGIIIVPYPNRTSINADVDFCNLLKATKNILNSKKISLLSHSECYFINFQKPKFFFFFFFFFF
jgi:hypothetical protein